MNLKLILSLSLLVGLVPNLIIVSAFLQDRWRDIPSLILLLFIIILIPSAFVLPVWVIAKKVHSRRFLHGFMVGIIGWTIGLLALIFPGSIVIGILATPDPKLFQTVGLLGFFIWLLGVITSPVIGFFSWLVGRSFDKKTMMQNSKTISKDKL